MRTKATTLIGLFTASALLASTLKRENRPRGVRPRPDTSPHDIGPSRLRHPVQNVKGARLRPSALDPDPPLRTQRRRDTP